VALAIEEGSARCRKIECGLLPTAFEARLALLSNADRAAETAAARHDKKCRNQIRDEHDADRAPARTRDPSVT